MKMRFVLMVSLLASALPMLAGMAKSDDEKAVLAAEKQLAAAMVKADIATLEKLLGDDLAYTHSSAKTESKTDVVQVFKTGSTKYKSVDYDTTKVRQFGNVVVTTHNMTIVNEAPNAVPSKLYVTLVWSKQGGSWQLVSRQATKLP
jgi:ketosteroid isomerase-like protein